MRPIQPICRAPLALGLLLVACAGHPVTPTTEQSRVEPSAAATSTKAGAIATTSAVPDGGVVDTIHGVAVADPFRWLEDSKDPAVTRWVDTEDEHARSFLKGLPHRDEFVARLTELGAEPRWTKLPRKRAGKYLYSRLDSQHDRGAIYQYDPGTKQERLILDFNSVRGNENLVPSWWDASFDGTHAVFRVSPNGGDAVQLRIFDIKTGKWLSEVIADARYSYPVWDPSGTGFYYTWSPPDPSMSAEKRTALSEIRFHRLSTSADADKRMREAPNADGIIEVPAISRDGRWLVTTRWYGTTRTTLFLRDLKARDGKWRTISPEGTNRYQTSSGVNVIYVTTNEGAEHGRVFRLDPLHPARENWKEIIPERTDAILAGADIIGDYLALEYDSDGEQHFEIHKTDGSLVKKLSAPGLGSIASIAGEPGNPEAAVSMCTYTQPYTPYLVRPPSFDFEPFPAGAPKKDAHEYVTEKVFYTSPDGTRAPIFIVRAENTPKQKPAPLILFGYGGFGESMVPLYHRPLRAWLDAGGIYAEAVVRGGSEYGDAWHRAGMKQKRANVYTDFIAASEYLEKEGWTDPTKLVLRGVSAGGLLVTVAMTERPELYAGVISEVPLTDMVRYQVGGNGPLWVEEYGSPDNPDEFASLLRYSPYHRVRAGVSYPWLLVMSNAEDDRTNPMHARKFVAAMQAANPSGVVLLRTEHNASHGGAYTQTSWVNSEADAYAFALAATNRHTSPAVGTQ